MKERPILFCAAMVRALLDGTKTQTRRVCKSQPYSNGHGWDGNDVMCHNDYLTPSAMLMDYRAGGVTYTTSNMEGWDFCCPYGQPGDRLWVRESFYQSEPFAGTEIRLGETVRSTKTTISYVADQYEIAPGRCRPSIHMPRWASRILLEIVSVRVEQLNDCSEADAKAEGVMQLDAGDCQRPERRTKEGWSLCPTCAGTGLHSTLGAGGGVNFDVDCHNCDTHAKLYRHLWESINGAGSWAINPGVWVIEFRRIGT